MTSAPSGVVEAHMSSAPSGVVEPHVSSAPSGVVEPHVSSALTSVVEPHMMELAVSRVGLPTQPAGEGGGALSPGGPSELRAVEGGPLRRALWSALTETCCCAVTSMIFNRACGRQQSEQACLLPCSTQLPPLWRPSTVPP